MTMSLKQWSLYLRGKGKPCPDLSPVNCVALADAIDSLLSKTMFADNGEDIERRMTEHAENACPYCGGSGHKGDVK
jgi:hypothetical protein